MKKFTIGTLQSNDIVIKNDTTVSRSHAFLFNDSNNNIYISDCNSLNGTYVSNKYQDMLLYCCLKNAYGYLKGPADLLQYYNTAFRTAMASYGVEQQGRRRRGEYDDGVIRTPIKSDSPSTY